MGHRGHGECRRGQLRCYERSGIVAVMNTDNLARTTFVLDRETSVQLDSISRRMGVSRSSLVRGVLREPVALMAGWLDRVPSDRPLTPADANSFRDSMQLDLVDFIERHSSGTGDGVLP